MHKKLTMQDVSLVFSHLEMKQKTNNLWLWFAKLEDAKKRIILEQKKKLHYQLVQFKLKLDDLKMLLFAIDFIQIYQKRYFKAETDATADIETLEERKAYSKKDKILTYILQIHRMRKKLMSWNEIYQKMLSDLREVFNGDVPTQDTVERIYSDWLKGGRTGRLKKRPKSMTEKLFDVMPEVELLRRDGKSFAEIQSILKRRHAVFNRNVPAISTIFDTFKKYRKQQVSAINKVKENISKGKNEKGLYEPFAEEPTVPLPVPGNGSDDI